MEFEYKYILDFNKLDLNTIHGTCKEYFFIHQVYFHIGKYNCSRHRTIIDKNFDHKNVFTFKAVNPYDLESGTVEIEKELSDEECSIALESLQNENMLWKKRFVFEIDDLKYELDVFYKIKDYELFDVIKACLNDESKVYDYEKEFNMCDKFFAQLEIEKDHYFDRPKELPPIFQNALIHTVKNNSLFSNSKFTHDFYFDKLIDILKLETFNEKMIEKMHDEHFEK